MIRRFYLENEYGTRWDLNSPNTGFFTQPEGLGYSMNNAYARIGDSFVRNYMNDKQKNISGILVFGTMDPYIAYNACVNFVNASNKLKLIYKTTAGEYYRDIDVVEFEKSEIAKHGALESRVIFACKGLFYSNRTSSYTVDRTDGEMRWDFAWPVRFNDYSNRKITINNNGHVPAPLQLEIYGYCENPSIAVVQGNRELYRTVFNVTLEEGEKLLYSSMDGNIYCIHVDANGVETNFADGLDIKQTNFFKLPIGESELKLSSDTSVTNKTILTVYRYFKAV